MRGTPIWEKALGIAIELDICRKIAAAAAAAAAAAGVKRGIAA